MDRYVTRAPTWKTLSYNSVVSQTVNRRSVSVTKTSSSQPKGGHKGNHPLQQKQLADLHHNSQNVGRRLSDIFRPVPSSAEVPAIENFSGNSNDSGLSSASSISPPTTTLLCPVSESSSPLNKLQTPTKNYLGKLGDYVDCPEEKENDICMTIAGTPKSSKKAPESKGLRENITPSKQLPQTPKATKQHHPTLATTTSIAAAAAANPLTPSKNPMLMSRIQRDLNSPSASVRVRALRAIASPTTSPYTHFDIPEAEQSLRFSDSQETRDIKDVMRNVIVYVEVRSGEDNRSEGVRKVIEALGARVNLNFNRDTTHVVFKEGLLSTYKKAQQWGIPVVSILWIEACKNQNRICDPKDFPISNLDRYENPELYSKMKKFKYMQPGSECNKRKVKAGGTPKDTTPTQKTGTTLKKNSTLIGGTPTSSSSSNQKKTDISKFFKKLDKTNKVLTTPKGNAAADAAVDSPATQLLNRITANVDNIDTYMVDHCDDDNPESCLDLNKTNKVKKALDFFKTKNDDEELSGIKATPPSTRKTRRSSVVTTTTSVVQNTPKSISRRTIMPIELQEQQQEERTSKDMATSATPSKRTTRRSSIHTTKNMTIETPKSLKRFQAIAEDNPMVEQAAGNNIEGVNTKSQTLYSAKSMDIVVDQSKTVASLKVAEASEHQSTIAPSKSGRRRTVYSYKAMNSSGLSAAIQSSNVTVRRPTCYSVKSIEPDSTTDCVSHNDDVNLHQIKEVAEKIAAEKSKELSKKILNLLNNTQQQELTDKPPPVKSATSSHRRRTLYTPKKCDEKKVAAAPLAPSLSDGICLTPTASNMQGKVAACSTLLESADKPTKFVETPPATATSGKLLEETNECTTPFVFSSTRQPGNKRRTLFDVSMDIITQRLQCINQSARKSLAPNMADNINNNTDVKSLETPPSVSDIKKSTILQDTDTDCENLNTTPLNSTVSTNNNIDVGTTESAASILKKKRKLFIPNETLTPPTIASATGRRDSLNSSTMKNLTTSAQNSVNKRRRTLMPFSQPTFSTSTLNLSTQASDLLTPVRKRRSTLDFEQLQKVQNKMNTNGQKSTEEIHADDDDDVGLKPKKMPVLVYTNMHKEQIDVIREAVGKLNNFSLEQTVSDGATHLVSLEPRRTMNLLRALARGLWIVEYTWVLDSMKAGEWLPEEMYELKGFSRAVEICRSERQAFGNRYKCELFRDIGAFYISLRCYPVTKDDLSELITLCGGRLSLSRNKARYIIGDSNALLADKMYITPYWVLDSISQMQIMKLQKYTYPKPFERPEPKSPIVMSGIAIKN